MAGRARRCWTEPGFALRAQNPLPEQVRPHSHDTLRGTRRAGRIEKSLHENEIEPASELVRDFAKMRHLFEAEARMHAQRGGVGGVDATDHYVLAQRCGEWKQRRHQARSDALPPAVGMHVHRVLDRITITRGPAELAEGSKTKHRILTLGD